ncbi:MAG TPA: phosphoribosylformylglycinamidine cyclo-ligase, partial [Actinobacteria bacterium]|nr:phosphoribosylformylglycinamidine cyclo-ligase [Actinomycetota bacterium]
VTGLHPGSGFDLVGTCVGTVDLDKIIVGQDLEPGDIIVGIASSGLHSNGFTLARRVLFEKMGLDVTSRQTGLDRTVGEELLEPTNIYVPEAMELLEAGVKIKSFAHITGDGLLNLTRTKAKVGFRITDLPDIPPIFTVIAEGGPVTPGEMWSVFNMGIGFCAIVDADDLSKTLEITGRRYNSQLIGHVTDDPRQRVHIEPYKLVGSPKTPFCAE